MGVLYAIICPELNSSEINQVEVQEQYLIGGAFLRGAEIVAMATPSWGDALNSTKTVSPQPLDVEGWLTTQNLQNWHIMGGQ